MITYCSLTRSSVLRPGLGDGGVQVALVNESEALREVRFGPGVQACSVRAAPPLPCVVPANSNLTTLVGTK